MIDLLKLSQKHGHHKLQEAIESALANRCYDGAAVQHLLNAQDLQHTSCEAIQGAMCSHPKGFVMIPEPKNLA